MKYNRSANGGYFTLEAVLILPIALAIILLVMRIWFFRYNRVLQETDTTTVLVHATQMRDMDAEERSSFAVSEMQNRYKDKYMAWNFGEISASIMKDRLSLSVSGSDGFSPGGLLLWDAGHEPLTVTERNKNMVSEIFVIRSYRKLLGVKEKMEELETE